jgi:hypothetical protein
MKVELIVFHLFEDEPSKLNSLISKTPLTLILPAVSKVIFPVLVKLEAIFRF